MQDYQFQMLAIVLYMVAMLFIGWYAFKRTSNLKEYMLGGRGLGPIQCHQLNVTFNGK
ncbi:hypothetical protein [Ureibacillus thermophilus]|uniref:hypothetical protein n=1 Tax=Ureibacillus thermophilus TaxID=367743 RepID=UPI001ABEEC6B|nr:hypothetical protein [Ureibacillus thermophilus]